MGIDPGFELRESDSQDRLETLSGAPDCRQLAGCAASLLLYVRPEGLMVDRFQSLKTKVSMQTTGLVKQQLLARSCIFL